MMTNKFLCEYLWEPYVLFLDPVLRIVLVSEEVEHVILEANYIKNN